ncbi:ABC transporter ATP-binding protein [Stackebrandtia nassauensis]|uniref:ABC transporter transmembrane region n=1 Tax=Stackebrandtia nassauensis (strain DSM 44728 / CIP 108903 / NRRL B-16338 / NBRC 102104 / LLR-40K-21) TaxID=446470 RepID=D3Q0P0_STANL|nr:ABC transporter ATP-binding protein [Stackebrandtia nassauensis]ADD41776.1 ABC transporter transmembrane region [Stackebrandtia nassauensis DSM 44728]
MRLLKPLPMPDPGEPDARSAASYLLWILSKQWKTLVVAGMFGTGWMACIGALPGAIGYGIDQGVRTKDTTALLLWAGVIVTLAALMAVLGIIRHRLAVFNFLVGAYRTVQLTTRHATRVGAALPRRIATGEVVSVGSADPASIGMALDVLGRTTGSVVTFVAVAVILLTISVPLGLVILLGLPLQALVIGPLLKPLQRREHAYREQQGLLTSRANDIVAGLRVLRGIGGEELFAHRYTERSQEVRRFGMKVAAAGAVMKGLQMLLPGLLLVAVTWIGARAAVSGSITPGQLIAVFGYTTFLLMPMSTFLETARKYTTAHAAAKRIVAFLAVEPGVDDEGDKDAPRSFDVLEEPESGLRVESGKLTAVACADPEQAAVLGDRLGRYRDSDAHVDGLLLRDIRLDELRQLVLVSDNDSMFFEGKLRAGLDVAAGADDETVLRAVRTAVAGDAVDSVGGLDGHVDAEARNVSGGQRQRLRLVRALLTDAPVLVLVEPTSAVDAHTEALIAERLREHREGATTVVTTTSPLMLERADTVCFVDDGKVVATGSHRELMDGEPRYRAVVTRDDEDEGQERQ